MENAQHLTDTFWKNKTGVELNRFLAQLYKCCFSTVLEGEFDPHFGYNKYVNAASANSRYGISYKQVKIFFEKKSNFPHRPYSQSQ